MKHSVLLTITSVLSILLFSLHITDDVVHGFDRVGPWNVLGILILVVWLCGALLWADRRLGLIIVLLGGVFAAGMPVLHWRGATVSSPEFARSPGAFFFLWTLWALGATGGFSIILAARGLWSLRAAKRSSPTAGA